MFKNVASQKLIAYAFDSTTNSPKTGDAANITAYVSKDYGSVTVLGDTSATEMDATNAKGYYLFDLTQAETNADTLLFSAKSTTANIVVIGVPATVFTLPASFTSFVTPPTAAAVATAVWQDTTAGDFTTSGSIGKSLFTSGAVPGAAGGLFIAGTNAATVITTSLTTHFVGTVDTVTTVTNQLTAAAIATGVWQDATAGDFTTASSIGKALYTGNFVPGATSGLAIVGSAMTLAASQHVIVDSGTVTTVTNQLTAAQIATGVWQDATAGDFTTASSIGKSLYTTGNAPGAASGLSLVGSAMALAASQHVIVDSGTVTTVTNQLTAAAIATGVWQDATAGDFTTASSIGKSLYTTGNAPGAASGLALVGSNMGTASSVTGAVGSVTAGVTVTTNNDKTGYTLTVTPPTAAAIATAIWQDATAGDFTTAGSIGKSLGGAFTALGTSVYTVGALANAPTGGSAPTVSQIATAVWQDATAGDFTTSGSIGKSLFTSGNVPGAASGLAIVGSNVGAATSVTGAVGSVTGNVGGDVTGKVLGGGASSFTAVGVQADVEQIAGNTGGVSRLDRSARAIVTGTVGTGSTTTSIVTSALSPAAVDTGQFQGRVLIFDKDTTTTGLRCEGGAISASTSGGVFTVDTLSTAPSSGDTFTIS